MNSNSNIRTKIEELKGGKLKCSENVQNFLSNIEKNNKKLNIVLDINKEAKNIAKELDKKRENKGNLGRLFGLCFLFKSNISIKNMNISCASNTLEKYKGTFDADVVRKIVEEDGIVLGIVNNDQFASGSSGETSAFGDTINPNAPNRVPGGSSSGSASAVAADFCDIALGSDTGGSVRNPASHCGVVGIKPSYGRVSRYGLVDLAMSFDQIGPLSNDLYGSELTLSVIAGHSGSDGITKDVEVPNYTEIKSKKLKIGIIKDFENIETDERIKDLLNKKLEALKSKGHEIVPLNIKYIDLSIQAYYPIVYTEFFSGTRKFDGVKYGEFIDEISGDEVKRRIFGGREISKSEFDGAYYKKALKIKEVMSKEFDEAFKKVDIILSPVTPILPHSPGTEITPEAMYGYDAFTIPANLSGICAGVISKDKIEDNKEQVPVGIQVFANKFNENLLFSGLEELNNL